jgi:hypothetical protein
MARALIKRVFSLSIFLRPLSYLNREEAADVQAHPFSS